MIIYKAMPVILRDSTLEFTMYLFCIFGQKCLDNAFVSIDNLVMQKSRGCEVSDINFGLIFENSICRQKQSIQQIGALFLLIIAAVLLSIGEGSSKGTSSADAEQILFYGIIPVLVASVLSGLASSLCQWASQVSTKKYFSLIRISDSIVLLIFFALQYIYFYYRSRNTHRT